MMNKPDAIVIADYDPAWPARFEEERAAIVAALGEATGGGVTIEHVGSTAVPGLAAKPIIDIMVGVGDPAAAERCVRPLEGIGYVYRGEAGVPGRLFFRKGNPRTHHVHVAQFGGEIWRRTLLFRDFLRAHPEAARQYGQAKRELARRFRASPEAYGPAKEPVVESILARARVWERPHPRPLSHCTDRRHG